MASKGKKAVSSEQVARKRLVRLELDELAHGKLRVMAAQNGLPMSQYVRLIVEEKISGKSSKHC